MTANQIAYASAIENQRHNEVSEQEMNRHNVEAEKLSQAQLNLESERLDFEKIYKTEQNRIQEAYNEAYLEYQHAALDKKYEIESQMNLLTQEKNRIQEWYNQKVVDYNAAQQGLDQQRIKETNRHNEAMETMEFWFNEKKLDYERSALNNQIEFNAAKMIDMIEQRSLSEVRNELSEQMNLLNYSMNIQKLQQDLDIWNAKASFMNAELISNNMLGGFKTGFSLFKPIGW